MSFFRANKQFNVFLPDKWAVQYFLPNTTGRARPTCRTNTACPKWRTVVLLQIVLVCSAIGLALHHRRRGLTAEGPADIRQILINISFT
jgi:hypothetical protein